MSHYPPPHESSVIPHRSIAVEGGRIISSQLSELSSLIVNNTRLDIPRGARILPGFVDTHCHLLGLGWMASRIQLGNAATSADCARRVAMQAMTVPDGDWIVGFGWNDSEWKDNRQPHKEILDAAAPDHPVVLYRVDTHAAWLNSRALQLAGINPVEIEGGSVERGEDGHPDGLLIDAAVKLVDVVIPPPSKRQQQGFVEYAVQTCLRSGITEVHDMNVELGWLNALTTVAESGGLRLRSNMFLQAQHGEWEAFGARHSVAPNLQAVGVKFFMDGALGSRGAWLLEPYSDAPQTIGLQLLEPCELAERAALAASKGYAIATHAIGDAANRAVLDSYEQLRGRFPKTLLRIEHAQIVHPDDVSRFAGNGIIAAMQPTHCTSDARMAEERLGISRCRYAYGWRALEVSACTIIGGSDFPVESPDPILGLTAFTQRTVAGAKVPWFGEQRISPASALAAYTANAPLGLPNPPKRGRLDVGYDADITVLTGNPFEDPNAQVLYTIVNGKIEYEVE